MTNKLRFEHESARLRKQMAARKAERGIMRKNDEIANLRNWIRDIGAQYDICTRHILGEVCEDCRCGKADRLRELGL